MACTGLVKQKKLKMLVCVRSPPEHYLCGPGRSQLWEQARCPALSQMLSTCITPDRRLKEQFTVSLLGRPRLFLRDLV